jgi:hypothetical protein
MAARLWQSIITSSAARFAEGYNWPLRRKKDPCRHERERGDGEGERIEERSARHRLK